MPEVLYIYLRYVAVSVRGQMQHRASFIMMSIGNFCYTVMKFLAIWILFTHFDQIAGWPLYEIALLYGIVHIASAVSELITPGFRSFGNELVKKGELDRLLLRPRSTALQLSAHGLQLSALGSVLQGLVVFIWATQNLSIAWTLPKVLILLLSILGGTLIFYGLHILEAALAFWTTQSLEFMNSFTRGGRMAAQYPFKAYQDWFRSFFTFVVPLAFTSYYPALFILDRSDLALQQTLLTYGAPVAGFIFFVLCLQVWAIGVKHYCSTGS